ncbi:uncharacterized protein LOC143037114 [Oratosquilla oratoria]|uniref:uncharacterized protein LOC143037114 n=1 Tax=Oratosquilla oratoria TaxID=337810 RepID=UPI003F75972C
MSLKVAVFFALVAFAVARPDELPTYSYSPPSQEDSHESLDIFETPKYEFTHSVKDEESANDFGHQEARDDENTQGSYYVQLPDGRLQKVTYYVDGDSGFVAEVSYEGEARYPEPDSSEERFYAAPAPSPPQTLYGAPSKVLSLPQCALSQYVDKALASTNNIHTVHAGLCQSVMESTNFKIIAP